MAVVSNHMTSDILTVPEDERLADAAKRMVERGVSEPVATGITFAIILAGLPVYWVAFGRRASNVAAGSDF